MFSLHKKQHPRFQLDQAGGPTWKPAKADVASSVDIYMASSMSGQDESNPALWLAIRAGMMELSCPLGTTRRVPQDKFFRKPYNKSFIDQVCSVKMAGYLPSFIFCELMDLDSVSVHKHAKKELGQYPAILTLHLVNNAYYFSYTLYKAWQPNNLRLNTSLSQNEQC